MYIMPSINKTNKHSADGRIYKKKKTIKNKMLKWINKNDRRWLLYNQSKLFIKYL